MRKSNLILAGLGVWLYSAYKKNPPETETPNTPTLQPGAENIVVTNKAVDTIEGTDAPIMDWIRMYKSLIGELGLKNATTVLWEKWQSETNKYRNYIKDPRALVLLLTTYQTYQPSGEIGAIPAITWQSTPLYYGCLDSFMGRESWDCQHWKIWHQKLEQHFGNTKDANDVWLTAWNNSSAWGWCPFDCMSRDCDFLKYLYSKGIDVSVGFWRLGDLTWCNIKDYGSAIVNNVGQGATNATAGFKTISTLVPYVAIGIGGLYLYKNRQKFS